MRGVLVLVLVLLAVVSVQASPYAIFRYQEQTTGPPELDGPEDLVTSVLRGVQQQGNLTSCKVTDTEFGKARMTCSQIEFDAHPLVKLLVLDVAGHHGYLVFSSTFGNTFVLATSEEFQK